jgi:gliding motility-associated-like protein
MTVRQTLVLIFSGIGTLLAGQNNCNNPIVINAIIVSNTTCSNTSGNIIVSPGGGFGLFSYEWTPAVSTSNVASNLPAGTYAVRITRLLDPDCTLDTTIVVNNSNGPQVQAAIDPADCLASNGSVTLSPANLLYSWSNGAGTNVVQGLASGTYYVTATNPNTGCYSVNKIFVPRSFDFNVSVNIQKHAKCGRNIGKAQILVAQGSGQYSYSLGAGPIFDGLAAGTYTCVVSDNITGCTGSVTFTILDLPVTGTVNLSTYDVRCAGDANGLVEINLTPGPNFLLPYTFTLVSSTGASQSAGSLAAGTYYLQLKDADQCPLPPDTFVIRQPTPLTVLPQVTPETCDLGGAINLQIAGGTGATYAINWLDLAGDINPQNRSNLEAGLYSVIVYDSLFCSKQFDNLLVAPLYNNLDTVFMVLKASTTDFYCWDIPVGLTGGSTTFGLLGGGLNGSSSNGNWSLNSQGCLSYSAGSVPGFAVDTICLRRTANSIGLKDTLCIIVTITAKQPTKQSVFFSVQTGQASEACGTIPAQFNQYLLAQIGRPGLTGASDVYGQYSINSTNGCISFFANNTTGFSVDEIRVGVFDTLLNECHIICYLPSIVPAVDCASFIQLADTLHLITTDCGQLATGCLPVPYDDIVNYTVIDNGVLYSSGYNACDLRTAYSYTVGALPAGGGPYQLTEWRINGTVFSGSFLNLAGLAALMNQLNPGQNWAVQGANLIRGGDVTTTYGALKVRSAINNTANYDPILQQVPYGTILRFNPGMHKVIFRNVLNACSDTTIIDVDCIDCPPVHSYALDPQGNLSWQIKRGCAFDTVFCTNIPFAERFNYTITDNQQPITLFSNCGNFVGMALDTGLHVLHWENTATTCAYDLRVFIGCTDLLPGETLNVVLAIGEQTRLCLDTTLLNSPITSMTNLCADDDPVTVLEYLLDQQQWCVNMTGLSLGYDTLCLQLCNASGQCANFIVHVAVNGAPSDSLLAVPDKMYTLVNTDVEIPIFSNDIINGITGNRFALAAVDFLSQPSLGTIGYNPLSGLVIYSPNLGACGVDSFSYRITDSLGQQSITTVTIVIACDKVLIFNGISPNGDGKNDTWQILGIEQYPGNEVRVFNRWGNQVFEQKAYTNTNAWDGTWNGKYLPDGTYFYILDLGGDQGKKEGYLQLMR